MDINSNQPQNSNNQQLEILVGYQAKEQQGGVMQAMKDLSFQKMREIAAM